MTTLYKPLHLKIKKLIKSADSQEDASGREMERDSFVSEKSQRIFPPLRTINQDRVFVHETMWKVRGFMGTKLLARPSCLEFLGLIIVPCSREMSSLGAVYWFIQGCRNYSIRVTERFGMADSSNEEHRRIIV
ncbi:hypothetical protein AVEN_222973-1 [Araneus ventricosus]|uniref:Uncharacterized protein n=1 Tax=Araneus ventricosus TaxID=182803 RepID=A0A4Y2TKH9_ARAVE|nr:hypothetical protein AVEN_222973-1 [Araneus ventricosus]